jgi:ABC-type transport system substrate-binding protein
MSEDGHTWTFHIRPDARWQDGVPVTAHDVVFTFDLMGDPAVSRRDPVAALDTAFAPSSQDRIHEASWEIFRRYVPVTLLYPYVPFSFARLPRGL